MSKGLIGVTAIVFFAGWVMSQNSTADEIDPQAGAVRVGGRDLRTLDPEVLRRHIAVVHQDTYLFHGTVEDNLRVGKPDATREEIDAACRAANAHDFITKFEHGLRTGFPRHRRLGLGRPKRPKPAEQCLAEPVDLILEQFECRCGHREQCYRCDVAYRFQTVECLAAGPGPACPDGRSRFWSGPRCREGYGAASAGGPYRRPPGDAGPVARRGSPARFRRSNRLAELVRADSGGSGRKGRSRRLLDVHVHQLAAHAAVHLSDRGRRVQPRIAGAPGDVRVHLRHRAGPGRGQGPGDAGHHLHGQQRADRGGRDRHARRPRDLQGRCAHRRRRSEARFWDCGRRR